MFKNEFSRRRSGVFISHFYLDDETHQKITELIKKLVPQQTSIGLEVYLFGRILWYTMQLLKKLRWYVNFNWVTRGYKMIVIPNIKNLTMSLEFILEICWLGLTFIFLEFDTRLFGKNVTFTIPDADDFGFYNFSHCLLCCATNYTISLRAEWRTGTNQTDSLSEVVVNTMYVVLLWWLAVKIR